MREFYYWLYSLIFPWRSLRAITWERIKTENVKAYSYKESFFKKITNQILRNHRVSFLIFVFLPILFPFLCFIPFYNSFLSILYFANVDVKLAADGISNNLENSATLIGISFVVLGFIFEIVKDRTHQTFMQLSSSINLFPVMGLSFSILLIHIGMNWVIMYADTNSEYEITVIKNLGICSWFLMVILVLGLIYLFVKMVSIFNIESINRHVRITLIQEAKHLRLKEIFVRTSREVYSEIMKTLGLKYYRNPFGLDHLPEHSSIKLEDNTRMIYDINLYKIQKVLAKYKPQIQPDDYYEFRPMQLDLIPNERDRIFILPKNDYFNDIKKKNLKSAIKLIVPSNDSHSFDSNKQSLIEVFHKSILDKNDKQLKEQLDNMREIYNVIYNSLEND